MIDNKDIARSLADMMIEWFAGPEPNDAGDLAHVIEKRLARFAPPAAEAPGQEPVADETERVQAAVVEVAAVFGSTPASTARAMILAMERRASPPAPVSAPPTYADAEAKGDGWHDISSAPRDGTTVDLWADGCRRVDFYCDDHGRWTRKEGYPAVWRILTVEPTHWRPRPTEPAAIRSLASPAQVKERPTPPLATKVRREVNDKAEILQRLADGDTICFSQDGELAWFTKGDRSYVGDAIMSLRASGFPSRRCDDEENYRGLSEYDTISDAGRAHLASLASPAPKGET